MIRPARSRWERARTSWRRPAPSWRWRRPGCRPRRRFSSGHDGIPYKRAYAAIGEPGDVAGFVAVEGNADYPATLASFRRSLISAGLVALMAVLALTLWHAGRISRPVVRLAEAAARLGRGDLDARVPIETRDEIGVLAHTLDETRVALKARDENMQMMLAGIAHEVRNPLGGLELYAGLLRDALAGQPERLEEVGRIDREVGHLKIVVSDFLEFARRPPPRLEVVPLRPVLDEIRELTEAPGETTVAVDASDALAVRADVGQLRRALLNLARNAVAAARPGRVEISAQRLDARVRIEVRDDGPGVPPEIRDKIFTPFFTTREKGTGLGLAFVREIVRDHDSDITVRDAPGGGTVFSFDLAAAERIDMTDDLVLTDRRFLDHDPGPGHPESPARIDAILDDLARAPIAGVAIESPRPATDAEIEAVHPAELPGGAGGPGRQTRPPGCRYRVSPGSWRGRHPGGGRRGGRGRGGAGGPRRATPSRWCARRGTTPSRNRRWDFACSTTPPSPPRPRRRGGAERVLIVDWDVHHGNGTQDIFAARSDVLYMSAHQYPFYPGTGAAHEVGVGAGRGATVNCPLPGGQGDADYGAVFHDLFLPVARAVRPRSGDRLGRVRCPRARSARQHAGHRTRVCRDDLRSRPAGGRNLWRQAGPVARGRVRPAGPGRFGARVARGAGGRPGRLSGGRRQRDRARARRGAGRAGGGRPSRPPHLTRATP